MAAFCSSIHSTTNETPNRLMLGREVVTPATLLDPPPPDATDKVPWVESLHQRFQKTYRSKLKQ